MCGIVGAIANSNIVSVLIDGLTSLEYRGYDSSGIAVLSNGKVERTRALGKVSELANKVASLEIEGSIGIAHTRWATHGAPSEDNAHPHRSEHLTLVHNGIIENYIQLKEELIEKGYRFTSQTDTEVIVHLIHHLEKSLGDLRLAVLEARKRLYGAYGMVVMSENEPDLLIAARSGSPLVVGFADNASYLASDLLALIKYTREFYYLNEGEVAFIKQNSIEIVDLVNQKVDYKTFTSDLKLDSNDKGRFEFFMEKEIYDQPQSITDTLEGRVINDQLNITALGPDFATILEKIENVVIVACGTSFHAALTAKYWFEEIAGVATEVEIASEFRYRTTVTRPNSLFVTVSQSGETADLLAALAKAKQQGYLYTLSICNVSSSSLVRESDLSIMTRAGSEISVASTKAFTTQLVSLFLIAIAFAKIKLRISLAKEKQLMQELSHLPVQINELLTDPSVINDAVDRYLDKNHALFIARGILHPIALEGSLKMKEITYIHCEAYAAGELKHGSLALVDENLPIIALAPSNNILDKVKSNLAEVAARQGQILVFTDKDAGFTEEAAHNSNISIIELQTIDPLLQPIYFTVPLQLLSYYTAVKLSRNPDRPRNLAKSVTVE